MLLRLAAAALAILAFRTPVSNAYLPSDPRYGAGGGEGGEGDAPLCNLPVKLDKDRIVQGESVSLGFTGAVGSNYSVSWGEIPSVYTKYNAPVTHKYLDHGSYRIRVCYYQAGSSGCCNDQFPNFDVQVANVPPTVVLSGITPTPTQKIPYTANATITCCDTVTGNYMDSQTISIDWNDGSPISYYPQVKCASSASSQCSTFMYSHTFVKSGTFTIAAVAKDGDGTTSATATATLVTVPPTVILTNSSIMEGDSTSIAFTDFEIPPNATVDWGDGPVPSQETNPSFTHKYLNDGNYTIKINYSYGPPPAFQAYKELNVYVANAAPKIVSWSGVPNTTQTIPYTATVVVTCSDIGVLDDENVWVNWNDGSSSSKSNLTVKAPSSENCKNLTFTHTFLNAGTFNISTGVTDSGGSSSIDKTGSTTATLVIFAPTVRLSTPSITEGDSTTLSFIGVGTSAYRSMSWGDGSVSSGTNASYTHTYLQNGDYVINVSYSYGSPPVETQTQLYIRVANAAPTISMSGIPNTTQAVPYNATVWITCADVGVRDDQHIIIDWNDSSSVSNYNVSAPASANCQNLNFSHQFRNAGTYTIKATVKEKNGGATQEKTSTLVTACVLPTVDITNSTIVEGSSVTITLTSQVPVLAGVNWRDGSNIDSGKQASFTHTYADQANYTIITSYATTETCLGNTYFSVTIANAAPSIQLSTNQSKTLTAAAYIKCFDNGTSDNLDIYVNWNDSSLDTRWPATTATCKNLVLKHTYAAVGTYRISAIVKDNSGALSQKAWSTVTIGRFRRLLRGVDDNIHHDNAA